MAIKITKQRHYQNIMFYH